MALEPLNKLLHTCHSKDFFPLLLGKLENLSFTEPDKIRCLRSMLARPVQKEADETFNTIMCLLIISKFLKNLTRELFLYFQIQCHSKICLILKEIIKAPDTHS